MIEFQNVSFQYHYEQYPLFQNVSFTLHDGLNVVLCDVMSGKTTLCKMLLGLLPPDSGKILVDGVDIYANHHSVLLADALNLPAKPAFFNNKTVLFNLQYPLKVRKQKNDQLVHGLAEQFGLLDVLKSKVRSLSAKQQKQLALARGLTIPRKTVLFDGFFDENADDCELSLPVVTKLFQSQMQVVFTTDAQLAAGNVIVIDAKTCIYQGDADGARKTVANLQWLSDGLNKL